MAIDTQTKRRSVSGYSGIVIAPLADGTIGAADREHITGLYAGIAASPPVAPDLAFQGDAYYYDGGGATGSITGGTVLDGPNQSSATGSITGGTVLPAEIIYD